MSATRKLAWAGLVIAWLLGSFAFSVASWWAVPLNGYLPSGEGGYVYSGSSLTSALGGGTAFTSIWPVFGFLVANLAGAAGIYCWLVFSRWSESTGKGEAVAAIVFGFVGLAVTAIATQLESSRVGDLSFGWVLSVVAWLIYLAAVVALIRTQEPGLEFETRPGSSDG